ncbi:MAG TPA: hypothetical protein VF676_06960 [Flavobacterium sp.]|jgi:hypothetical protein
MKKTQVLVILACIFSVLFSCKDDKEEEAAPEAVDHSGNLNVSILLDLSDRISPEKYPNPAMEYYLRDVGYINSISEAFTDHLTTKKVRQVKDKIQLFFDPAPKNPDINALSEKMKIAVDRNSVSKQTIADIRATYASEPQKIYDLAINDKNYIGSDTWKFFKNKADDYCIEPKHRNILIVLTDGYIFYKDSKMQEGNKTTWLTPETIRTNKLNTSSWKETFDKGGFGFIPANKDLSNLEILVLGINPDTKNQYEEEVIKAYWSNWLEAMKVKRFEIHNAELPADMDKIIKDFIAQQQY